MRKNLILGLLISPLLLTAQEHGIAFVHGLNWSEILQKAKAENKYIFVDCYATWCGPCKYMDQQVYPKDSVGIFMNDKFVSLKIQMDTTNADNVEVQDGYALARSLEEKYHIETYPGFLFFSSDGKVLHKDMGSREIDDFLVMARVALDDKRQYYTLLANYRRGDRDYAHMAVLADEAIGVQQDSLAMLVGRDYTQHYLESLPENQLWSFDNVSFVCRHRDAILFNDRIFRSWYLHRKLIDSVIKESGKADQLIYEVVYRDRVKPTVDSALRLVSEPNWNRLQKGIASRCDADIALKNVVRGRVEYYQARKIWVKYVKYFIWQQEENGIETWPSSEEHEIYLNNNAFEVFQHSNDKHELEKALSWVDRALDMSTKTFAHAQAMDTKANILYRLGRKSEGLALEEQSHTLSPKDRDITANYEKMKNGLPTWTAE